MAEHSDPIGETQSKPSQILVATDAQGAVVVAREGLSFWGGVDPETGRVIDAHHDLHGQSLAGKIVLMPTSRGSCSGSGVLLQLALNGHAPAALVFREAEEVLTLGSLIAAHMFDRPVAVLRLTPADFDALSQKAEATLKGTRLTAGDLALDLATTSHSDLGLTKEDREKLEGGQGRAVALAMQVLCTMASAQGARRLIDVTRGHIDGSIYAHEANLIFAEAMAEMGAQVALPTTINAISVERNNLAAHDLPPDFSNAACRLADAYVRMGAQPTFTCAPYLLEDAPGQGEDIGWSESNAVIYANSVLGARTAKHPDYLDLFVALTGRAPEAGVYLDDNRRARVVIDVACPEGIDDAFWPLLGWIAGRCAPDSVALINGVEKAQPSKDDLRGLCAAFGTTSAAPLVHVAGITPESDLPPRPDARHVRVTPSDLRAAWAQLNTGTEQIDLVAIGSPHASYDETRRFAALMRGRQVCSGTKAIVTLGRAVLSRARADGVAQELEKAGVQLIADLCWCSIVEPIFPTEARCLMTNSGKYAHYAEGLSGRAVRFGGLVACAEAACSGHAPTQWPVWLDESISTEP
ncbi:aconitase X [Primorskyibacter sp. S187A]|uniref:cis-3-hydroxy-L-proline dehydratase n=1 Tax=Primorskyibacter sp. S187A TaxID=3415130 RepID=UPI003C79860E